MNKGIVLMLAVVAACAIARTSEGTVIPAMPESQKTPRERPNIIPEGDYFRQYIVPKYILPYFLGYEESPQMPPLSPHLPKRDWLSKEIERINQMEVDGTRGSYGPNIPQDVKHNPYFEHVYDEQKRNDDFIEQDQDYKSTDRLNSFIEKIHKKPLKTERGENVPLEREDQDLNKNEERMKFAFTPLDKEYYERKPNAESKYKTNSFTGAHEGEMVGVEDIEPPRRTRQNPNLSKDRNLVIGNLGKIQHGIHNEEQKVTTRPDGVNIAESPTMTDPADSIYSVAVIAAVGAAFAMAIFGFAIGWYTLSKKAKAAADVDYPAYGVTGPSIDMSGDRKLAHSAHMYHYQHQKQQIIAMERDGLEHRNGSVSDPESEVENEEGDYTVYECPGFATTGNMEVKNPLFSEDPSPLTPGKCQVVKQQPKD